MNFPSYSRYDYCVERACEFLELYKINSYPIDLVSLIQETPYALVPYSEIMSHFNCTLETVCKSLKSNEGRTVYHDGLYTIAYNDINKSNGRILFTLAHELGHIFLNHMIDFKITEIPKNSMDHELERYQYQILEREANAFARNILVPIPLYYFIKDKSVSNLQKLFGITYDAAVVRINLIEKDYRCSKSLGLYERFVNLFLLFKNKKICSNCNAKIIQSIGDFCPICGSKNTLRWGDGKMIYKPLKTHEHGKLTECPICHNEETNIDGPYCQICGSLLINHCANRCELGHSLPANARYCMHCGGNSTFYNAGFLREWNYKEPTSFLHIPDLGIEDDEELPFN